MRVLMIDACKSLLGPARWSPDMTLLTDIDTWAGAKVPVVARYLDTGGDPDVEPTTADEVRGIHEVGRAVFPVYNGSRLNGGHKCANAQEFFDLGVEDAKRSLQQANAISVPAGVYLGCDIEYGAYFGAPKDGANWWVGYARTMRASDKAGAGVPYFSATSPGLVDAYLAALATGDPDVARLLFWLACWSGGDVIAANLPAWDLTAVHPEIAKRTVAIQFRPGAYGGACDLSILDTDALAAAGPGGLWLPEGATPAPVPTPALPAPKPRPVLCQVKGTVDQQADKFYINPVLGGPAEANLSTQMIFDTGAFELLLDTDTAKLLGLPNLGSEQLSGVTGSAAAFNSKVNIRLGDLSVDQVDCAVMADAPRLFGLRLFIERGWALEVDTKAGTLTVYGPEQ